MVDDARADKVERSLADGVPVLVGRRARSLGDGEVLLQPLARRRRVGEVLAAEFDASERAFDGGTFRIGGALAMAALKGGGCLGRACGPT